MFNLSAMEIWQLKKETQPLTFIFYMQERKTQNISNKYFDLWLILFILMITTKVLTQKLETFTSVVASFSLQLFYYFFVWFLVTEHLFSEFVTVTRDQQGDTFHCRITGAFFHIIIVLLRVPFSASSCWELILKSKAGGSFSVGMLNKTKKIKTINIQAATWMYRSDVGQ